MATSGNPGQPGGNGGGRVVAGSVGIFAALLRFCSMVSHDGSIVEHTATAVRPAVEVASTRNVGEALHEAPEIVSDVRQGVHSTDIPPVEPRAGAVSSEAEGYHSSAVSRVGEVPLGDLSSSSASKSPESRRLAGEVFEHSELPEYFSYQVYGEEAVRNPRLITAFPTNTEEYRNVYGREPTFASDKQMQRLLRLYTDGQQLNSAQPGEEILLLELARVSSSSPVVIVGHSEASGSILVLPNGERIPVQRIHHECLRFGIPCIVVTCDGSDLAIDGSVTANEAHQMWQAATLAASRRLV